MMHGPKMRNFRRGRSVQIDEGRGRSCWSTLRIAGYNNLPGWNTRISARLRNWSRGSILQSDCWQSTPIGSRQRRGIPNCSELLTCKGSNALVA